MEPTLVKILNTLFITFLGYQLILPVIKNQLDDYHKHSKLTLHIYKIACAILIFDFVFNVGDIVFNFGEYFLISVGLGWSAVSYCIYYWVNDVLTYEPK